MLKIFCFRRQKVNIASKWNSFDTGKLCNGANLCSFIFQISSVLPCVISRARYEWKYLEIAVFLVVTPYSLLYIYEITGRHIVEDNEHHSQRYDKLKFYTNVLDFYYLVCLQLDSNWNQHCVLLKRSGYFLVICKVYDSYFGRDNSYSEWRF
jgi:hypothetical protein